jgi:hypothetical protein
MPILTQIILISILALTCFAVAFVTGYSAKVIRRQITENKARLSALKRGDGQIRESVVKKLENSLADLKKELQEMESSSLFSSQSTDGSLSQKIRSSLPLIIGITIGVIVGAIVIVLVPTIILLILFTLATFVGSSGLLLEFTRNEKKILAVSTIPAGLYVATQIFDGLGLFGVVFWLFDAVVIFTLIGVSLIFGKEFPIEAVIVMLIVLSAWDIYSVIYSPIIPNAVLKLQHMVFSLQAPGGLIGGGDIFFSYLLVVVFARRLKKVPLVLIGSIAVSLAALVTIMYALEMAFAPALPSVLLAGLVSAAYYRNQLRMKS